MSERLAMTDAEEIATLSGMVDRLLARQVAIEAIVEHMMVPVIAAVVPRLAMSLVDAARMMDVDLLPDDPMRLAAEEAINQLADRIERKLRSISV
jgi:hypothetical protein